MYNFKINFYHGIVFINAFIRLQKSLLKPCQRLCNSINLEDGTITILNPPTVFKILFVYQRIRTSLSPLFSFPQLYRESCFVKIKYLKAENTELGFPKKINYSGVTNCFRGHLWLFNISRIYCRRLLSPPLWKLTWIFFFWQARVSSAAVVKGCAQGMRNGNSLLCVPYCIVLEPDWSLKTCSEKEKSV